MIPQYGFVKLRVIKGLKTYDHFSGLHADRGRCSPGSEGKLTIYCNTAFLRLNLRDTSNLPIS